MPDTWQIGLTVYNVYEATALGATVAYEPDQVPDTRPFPGRDDNRESIFEVDIEHPLELPFHKRCLAFWEERERICRDLTFEGRAVELSPWAPVGTDGPLTVACNVRGSEFLVDLIADPGYADRLLWFLTDTAIKRREAFHQHWGDRIARSAVLADDSCALISAEMYRERLLPLHREWYQTAGTGPRGIHLCGDATRHFRTIHEQLNVTSFDTGFPVDHGWLRAGLGPSVEILGGPQVVLLLGGSPAAVYERAKEILLSGVQQGGRFILCEGNHLAPNVPEANLEAMYQAALDHGQRA